MAIALLIQSMIEESTVGLFRTFTCASVALMLSANASAVLVSTVGANDTLATSGISDNSKAEEQAWMEAEIAKYLSLAPGSVSITYTKLDGAKGSNWQQVTENDGTTVRAGEFAFDFGAGNAPAFYLVKTGTPQGVTDTHYLFENLDALQWAYVSLSDFSVGGGALPDVLAISHMATADGIAVPEPGPLALLGLGILGLALGRRLRRTA